MHRDEWDDEDEEPKWAGAPLTTKEKDMLRYYYYIHNGIDTRSFSQIILNTINRKKLRAYKSVVQNVCLILLINILIFVDM